MNWRGGNVRREHDRRERGGGWGEGSMREQRKTRERQRVGGGGFQEANMREQSKNKRARDREGKRKNLLINFEVQL